jgi:hypothetical protein
MKAASLFLSALLLTNAAAAGPEAEAAKKQAQRCADAQIAKDYATVVSFTHPALVKASGGKEALRKALEAAMKQVAEQKITFEKTVIRSAAEPKKVEKALVSTLVQEVTLRTGAGKLTQESTLLGYSFDGGKNWVFADTGEMDEAAFNKFFPDLKGIISLPEKKDPVLVQDK